MKPFLPPISLLIKSLEQSQKGKLSTPALVPLPPISSDQRLITPSPAAAPSLAWLPQSPTSDGSNDLVCDISISSKHLLSTNIRSSFEASWIIPTSGETPKALTSTIGDPRGTLSNESLS